MKDLFEYLGTQFAELIPDLEVREAKSNITSGKIGNVWNPFDNHLYLAFNMKDNELLPAVDISKTRFSLCAQSLAKVLNQFQIVETQALQLPSAWLGARAEMVQVGSLPVRFMSIYDSINQVTRISADLLVRHVGNFYRKIINGPMHRLEMPFKDDPCELWFDYNYLPLERPNYYQSVAHSEDYDDSVLLPGLDKAKLYPEHLHSYCVKGDYCYYTGELLHS
jgi:hypothetical protein